MERNAGLVPLVAALLAVGFTLGFYIGLWPALSVVLPALAL